MGLIKKGQIKAKGTIVIEKKAGRPFLPVPKPLAEPVKLSQPKVETKVLLEEDIAKVKSEAQKIIDQALDEAEKVREDAYNDGYAEGEHEAAEKTTEALAIINQAVLEKKKILNDAEPEILRLAIKVAEQIIRSEVSLHRDVCLNIVAEAITRVSDREQVIVRVNREDSEFLKRYKDRLAGILDGVRSFSILEDQTIEPGGCVIETSLGFIDSKISTKLKSIEEAFARTNKEIEQERVHLQAVDSDKLPEQGLEPLAETELAEEPLLDNDEFADDLKEDF
ncbi:hypothetical protein COT42_03840 [Candidatus Saganbacteria bacterium CG08_land_8_20_14_0_20_45_16]|uniref:Flagellar assembly protein FliH/Type III secretion system HrpE domain-containing protein n=1 Tax=Candidatus Saganbacteria bacterium CG08_land_8_20_14_0_20_45_16 TaxID=2014293 RepID=A0A2H0XYB2_UNCSA|nr:MAG: hypothetical protein COT42_03840 [Candidatus Saganbacteria bacterium CG08_land_8_20_14_0_20_45_16]